MMVVGDRSDDWWATPSGWKQTAGQARM